MERLQKLQRRHDVNLSRCDMGLGGCRPRLRRDSNDSGFYNTRNPNVFDFCDAQDVVATDTKTVTNIARKEEEKTKKG